MKRLTLLLPLLSLAEAGFSQSAEDIANNEGLRANKSWSLTAGLGARSDSNVESALAASYFLSSKSLVTLSLMSLSGSIKEQADGEVDGNDLYFVGVTTEIKGSAFAANYKQFISDSFYVEGGLDYTNVRGEFKISKDVLGASNDLSTDLGHYSRLSAMIQIGNQWQWNNFTLGTSWIGMLAPLYVASEFTDATFFGEIPNSARKFEKSSDETQVTLLRFYLGWSF